MDVYGDDQIYIHLEKDGNVFSVDGCHMLGLPGYEEYMEPEEIVLVIVQ